jgi:hypothetical protein
MKIKVSEAKDQALDWLVAKCAGGEVFMNAGQLEALWTTDGYKPSTLWAQGGPIIEREGIEIHKGNPLYFPQGNEHGDYYEPLWLAGKQHGQTPLIAAMRCYVASKLGDEVDVPEVPAWITPEQSIAVAQDYVKTVSQ